MCKFQKFERGGTKFGRKMWKDTKSKQRDFIASIAHI